MPQVPECLLFEWGWPYIILLILVALAIAGFIATLFWFLGLTKVASGTERLSWKDFKLKGPAVRVVVFVLAVGLVGWAIYDGYSEVSSSYAARLDTATTRGVTLETVRDKFQDDTHTEISIQKAARDFVIKGDFAGACVPDLFKTICRQYANQLTCEASLIYQTLTVGLKPHK